jgi:gluconokinase
MKQVTEQSPPRWVVMGVSGCGKSAVGRRLAAALDVEFIEGDAFHSAANVDKMAAGIPLTDDDRADWLLLLQDRLARAHAAGVGVVLACSALKKRYRDVLRAGEPDLCFAHLDGDAALIAQRMQARNAHFMPASLLASQLRDLEPLSVDECGVRLDVALPVELLVRKIAGFRERN